MLLIRDDLKLGSSELPVQNETNPRPRPILIAITSTLQRVVKSQAGNCSILGPILDKLSLIGGPGTCPFPAPGCLRLVSLQTLSVEISLLRIAWPIDYYYYLSPSLP